MRWAVRSAIRRPPAWTEQPVLAGKRDQPVEAAVAAAKPRKPARDMFGSAQVLEDWFAPDTKKLRVIAMKYLG
jgi:hypothetical protein